MKQRILALAICACAVIAFSAPASADEGKGESGKGWYGNDHGDWRDYGGHRGGYEREDWRDDYYYKNRPRRSGKHAEIPYGHLPPPGECRTWYPDLPPGHQPPPHRC
jgi:hypothetical protein